MTEFKVQFKLSCSVGLNDTVALEATAALVSSPDGNQTVSVRACNPASRLGAVVLLLWCRECPLVHPVAALLLY